MNKQQGHLGYKNVTFLVLTYPGFESDESLLMMTNHRDSARYLMNEHLEQTSIESFSYKCKKKFIVVTKDQGPRFHVKEEKKLTLNNDKRLLVVRVN